MDYTNYAKTFCYKHGMNKTDEFSLVSAANCGTIPNFYEQIKYFRLKQFDGKVRKIATIKNKQSYENFILFVLCEEISKLYPKEKSCNQITESLLFDYKKIKDGEFTILRFDFKNYYDSISSEYVYKKYLKGVLPEFLDNALQKYIEILPVCKAGMCLSNILTAFMSNKLLEELKKQFPCCVSAYNYVDDFLFVFNKQFEKQKILDMVSSVINRVYKDNIIVKRKCKTAIHTEGSKFTCISKNDLPYTFNFVGYEYLLSYDCGVFSYNFGLNDYSIKRYTNLLTNFVINNKNNIEKVRRFILFKNRYSFVSYIDFDGKRKVKTINILHSHKLMLTDVSKINEKTKNFMQNIVFDVFEKNNIPLPYYLKDKNVNSGYNLWYNFVNKRSLFVDESVLSKEQLNKYLCVYDIDTTNMSYSDMSKKIVELYSHYV